MIEDHPITDSSPAAPTRGQVETYILEMIDELARLAGAWSITDIETELRLIAKGERQERRI